MVAGVATSISLVGIAYYFLLRNIWAPEGLQLLADVLLHYVVPVLYMVYWWRAGSKASIPWVGPLVWSIYPVAYLAYALVRGTLIGSYPYPFIDVTILGYEQTLLNASGLLLAYIVLGLLLVALGKTSSRNVR